MPARDAKSPTAFGFLTVLEHEQHGLVGGYLVLNPSGRPLEFHCTAPVKPSRAQQILFGPTLQPYLYGEQIGQTLLAKASLPALAVFTNVEPMLHVRPFVELPVALILDAGAPAVRAPSNAGTTWRCDRPHAWSAELNTFHVGRNHLAVMSDRDADREHCERQSAALAAFDLGEPFERIHEAIEEAHKVGRA